MTTVVKIGVDGFPIDPANIYYEQHLAIDPIIKKAISDPSLYQFKIRSYSSTQSLLKQNLEFQLKTTFAVLERLDWFDKHIFPKSSDIESCDAHCSDEIQTQSYTIYSDVIVYDISSVEKMLYDRRYFKESNALNQLFDILIGRDLNYTESDLLTLVQWYVINYNNNWYKNGIKYRFLVKISLQIKKHPDRYPLSKEFRSQLRQLSNLGLSRKEIEAIDYILRDKSKDVDPNKLLKLNELFNLGVSDRWADAASDRIGRLKKSEQENWRKLLVHASKATQATPSSKWLKTAKSLLDKVGIDNFKSHVCELFDIIRGLQSSQIAERNRLILAGLIWFYSLLGDEIELEPIVDLTVKCYQNVRYFGPVCHKAGNAGLWLLGEIGTFQAIDCMEKLRKKVSNHAIQKQIEKYLDLAAKKTGLSREDLEELSIPTYNLDRDGTYQQTLGNATATIKILGTQQIELAWTNNGKPQKSVPADVKANFTGELKSLKRTVDEIKKTLSIQRDRLEQMYLNPRSWDLATWRDRYLNHPLLSHLTHRLIWQFETDGKNSRGIWYDGKLVDANGTEIEGIGDPDRVKLWHPIDSTIAEVLEWRLWLEARAIVQPFKQAHREVYLLTDAERVTNNYSNRFAAHIIRQHQFASLCKQRGWNTSLIGGFDSDCTPTCDLPQWDLQIEFWVDVASQELSDSYIYLYLSTDQVRFCDRASRVPRNLDTIPALVFSEVMRTVDLFVGVCSVGNDPNWVNGGNANIDNYWESYSFGELGVTAQLRRELLARLIPKLKIRDFCSFAERYLVVRGELNTYRIHLGSGNILMEPGSRYLCIVPDRLKASSDKLILPFEGDSLLSVILSKAFLLANDRAITDPSIISQIKHT